MSLSVSRTIIRSILWSSPLEEDEPDPDDDPPGEDVSVEEPELTLLELRSLMLGCRTFAKLGAIARGKLRATFHQSRFHPAKVRSFLGRGRSPWQCESGLSS
jgi:hypothetical protein